MKNFIFIIPLLFFSCNSGETSQVSGDTIVKSTFKKENTAVRVMDVLQGSFNLEILSNGKAYAINNADIRFPINVKIQSIRVRNGESVRRGQVLAILDGTELKSKLARSKEAVDKAGVELDDRLIDYGYRLKDSSKIPADIMRMAKIKSGYNSARYDYADAKAALNETYIVAPFSGKIANLEARIFNTTDAFKKLCTLIDDSEMQVEFNVLETEYHFLSKGSAVEVIPYGEGLPLKGIVTQINPLIDDNGMIKIIAIVDNSGDHLLNGMSVKVIVKKSVPDKIYIPKEAVLQRQNRQVVFTYEDGRAKWNYVETDLQNSKYICISSGLKSGQKVIISNNINLAHDAEVTLDKTDSGRE